MTVDSLRSLSGKFSLLSLNQVPKLVASLGLSLTDGRVVIDQIVRSLVKILSPHASGLVLDAEYSLPFVQEKQSRTGVAISLTEASEGVDPLALPALLPQWGVEAVHNNFGVAHLELWYHPNEANALQKKQMVSELFDYCRKENIALAFQLMLYTPADQEFNVEIFQNAQLQAISELRTQADLLFLQHPRNSLGCATLTAELDIPWLVIDEGLAYAQWKEVVRESLDGGAAGAVSGESLWAELGRLRKNDVSPDMGKITSTIETTVRDRLIELTRIVDEYGETAEDE